MMSFDYDMVVIGGGSAGLTAAGMSALLGAKTLLVERSKLGGECTWTGCIPSKTLLQAARAAHTMRTANRFGIGAVEPEISFARVMEHVRSVRERIYKDEDSPEHLEKLGVEVIAASARFEDARTIVLNDRRRVTSRYFIVATGSRPKKPAFEMECLTNESVFELTSLPKRLLVMGAGPVGVEMAQAFQRLGSAVTVVTPDDRILAKDDAEHAAILLRCLTGEGISFVTGQKVTAATQGCVTLGNGQRIECDAVLAAIGREPNVEGLDLAKAGVQMNDKGVVVNRNARTSQRHIFACGDVTGRHQFTHMAEHMAKVAVTNAILRWPASLDEKHVVWATFTDPEVAHLGSLKGSQKVYRLPFSKLDRAITEGETTGEVRVMADGPGRIQGVSIVGAHASEMIAEYALAMRNGLRLSDIAKTIHPYPSYMLGNRKAADQATYSQLDSPLLKVLGQALGYRGVRKGARAFGLS